MCDQRKQPNSTVHIFCVALKKIDMDEMLWEIIKKGVK